jgi:hypothetical protein
MATGSGLASSGPTKPEAADAADATVAVPAPRQLTADVISRV